MDTQNTLDSIPIDLFHEIFSRLPIKTVGRCRCVSKILASRLDNEDFKGLFLTRSLTRPRVLFAVQRNNNDWVFYSSPHPQNPHEKSSLVVRPDFHTKFPSLKPQRHGFLYGSGLLYFPYMCISTTKCEEDHTSRVICNPCTGQYVISPKLETEMLLCTNLLGFDPIDKQFKVLLMNDQIDRRSHFILTLGTGKMRWRTIKFPFLPDYELRWSNGMCINGVLYYLSQDIGRRSYVIVSFDVRTETFKLKPIVIDIDIDIEGCRRQLINHKGKLSITILRKEYTNKIIELYMLVLEKEEDVDKHEWLKYTFPSTIKFNYGTYVVGMTSTDDIVLSTTSSRRFYLYYFNLEKKSLQSVEVRGIGNQGTVHVFMDHVDDLYVNDAKYFKSNIRAHLPQGIKNTFQAQCLKRKRKRMIK